MAADWQDHSELFQGSMTIDDTIANHSQVTQCPHCDTAFLVSDEQLVIADGQVRCGSCLGIFQADQYWLSDTPALPASAALDDAGPGSIPSTAASAADRLDADSCAAQQHSTAQDQAAASDSFEFSDSFLELSKPAAEQAPFDEYHSADDQTAADGEQWARELLEEEEEEQQHRAPRNKELSAILDQPTNRRPAPGEGDAYSSDTTLSEPLEAEQLDSAEKWMQQVLGQDPIDEEEEGYSAASIAPPVTSVSAEESRPVHSASEEPTEEYVPEIFRQSFESEVATPSTPPNRAQQLLASIGNRCRQILNAVRNWLIRMLTLVAIALALLTLAAQLIWQHADQLANQAVLRPAVARFCQIGGCELATAATHAAIHQRAAQIYRPAGKDGVLILASVLTNASSSQRPYPALSITLTDHRQRAVAQGIFEPAQYLTVEQQAQPLMSPGENLHLALQLVDPGAEAANFRIALLWPGGY